MSSLTCPFRGAELSFGFCSDKGSTREENEDILLIVNRFPADVPFALFSIFDGHGGNAAAMYAYHYYPEILMETYRSYRNCKVALRRSLIELDRRLMQEKESSGAVALVYIICHDGSTAVAHIGDSEGLIVRNRLLWSEIETRPLSRYVPLYSTLPHNISINTEESGRLLQEGGILEDGRLCYLDLDGQILGYLAVSRSLGDYEFKVSTPLICIPECEEDQLNACDQVVVMASDGLWDALSQDDVYTIVNLCRNQEISATEMAEILTQLAIKRGSQDNVTVIVILLPSP